MNTFWRSFKRGEKHHAADDAGAKQQQNGVKVFENAIDVVTLGDAVDIIFDLTGDSATRSALRKGLQESNNHHTVIAPEVMAKLLSMFFDGESALDEGKGGGY